MYVYASQSFIGLGNGTDMGLMNTQSDCTFIGCELIGSLTWSSVSGSLNIIGCTKIEFQILISANSEAINIIGGTWSQYYDGASTAQPFISTTPSGTSRVVSFLKVSGITFYSAFTTPGPADLIDSSLNIQQQQIIGEIVISDVNEVTLPTSTNTQLPVSRILSSGNGSTRTFSSTSTNILQMGITPYVSGRIKMHFSFDVYNDTVGDGIQLTINAAGTQLLSKTYTQEGLANNPHTMVLDYILDGQTLGTGITVIIYAITVTGGSGTSTLNEASLEEVMN